jgi:DNA repair protein RadC
MIPRLDNTTSGLLYDPKGNVQPIDSDITITRKIKESGMVMDIQLLDHLIIVPEGTYYSMGDEGVV